MRQRQNIAFVIPIYQIKTNSVYSAVDGRSFLYMSKINATLFIRQSAPGWSIVRELEGSNEKLNRTFVGGGRPTSFRQIENPMLIAISNCSLRLISIRGFVLSFLDIYHWLFQFISRCTDYFPSIFHDFVRTERNSQLRYTEFYLPLNIFNFLILKRKPLDKLMDNTREDEINDEKDHYLTQRTHHNCKI